MLNRPANSGQLTFVLESPLSASVCEHLDNDDAIKGQPSQDELTYFPYAKSICNEEIIGQFMIVHDDKLYTLFILNAISRNDQMQLLQLWQLVGIYGPLGRDRVVDLLWPSPRAGHSRQLSMVVVAAVAVVVIATFHLSRPANRFHIPSNANQ